LTERRTNDLGCEHPDVPHTVWWSDSNEDDWAISMLSTFPASATFDTRDEAVAAAERIRDDVEGGRRDPTRTTWIKVFRSDNESYTCWRWPLGPAPSQPKEEERS
jgi:hypothetical protein